MLDVKKLLTKMLTRIDNMHPVGSIYISTSSVSPATIFGGTWVQIKGRFLLGTGTPDANTDNYFGAMSGTSWNAGAKSKGGQDYHTLTVNEMPSHSHGTAADYLWGNSGPTAYSMRLIGDGTWPTGDTGGGQQHNNMPPYFAVYMWERTA